jgi:hypothetical protein
LKYQVTPAFEADWKRLTKAERDTFRAVVRQRFHAACERYIDDPAAPWPRGLRVRRIQGAMGVWEMTWSFAGPDGRGTFEWATSDGEPIVRWRRIGGHEIFGQP